MADIVVKEVRSKRQLKTFIRFPFDLYRDNPYWVPPIIRDEMEFFNPKKNPSFEQGILKNFLAYQEEKLVGRICGIVSEAANEKDGSRNIRFGWLDAVDDRDVVQALINAVESWGRQLGMDTITGPHGFTDLDPEGMLIEGYDTLPTIVGIYNHPYLPLLVETLGFQKDIDYLEYLTEVPHKTGIPPKLLRIADRVRERSQVRILKFKSKKEVMRIAPDIFRLINETFKDIYGTVPFSERQIAYNVKKYISFLDIDMIKVAVDSSGELVGFMFTVPSLSKAFQRAKGNFFPFGIYHILKAFKRNDVVDFYMASVKKSYQGKGVDLLMSIEIVKMALKRGFKYAESNLELESNTKVQAMWKPFNPKQHRRRIIFRKEILSKPDS